MPDGEFKKRNPFAEEFLFSTVYRDTLTRKSVIQ